MEVIINEAAQMKVLPHDEHASYDRGSIMSDYENWKKHLVVRDDLNRFKKLPPEAIDMFADVRDGNAVSPYYMYYHDITAPNDYVLGLKKNVLKAKWSCKNRLKDAISCTLRTRYLKHRPMTLQTEEVGQPRQIQQQVVQQPSQPLNLRNEEAYIQRTEEGLKPILRYYTYQLAGLPSDRFNPHYEISRSRIIAEGESCDEIDSNRFAQIPSSSSPKRYTYFELTKSSNQPNEILHFDTADSLTRHNNTNESGYEFLRKYGYDVEPYLSSYGYCDSERGHFIPAREKIHIYSTSEMSENIIIGRHPQIFDAENIIIGHPQIFDDQRKFVSSLHEQKNEPFHDEHHFKPSITNNIDSNETTKLDISSLSITNQPHIHYSQYQIPRNYEDRNNNNYLLSPNRTFNMSGETKIAAAHQHYNNGSPTVYTNTAETPPIHTKSVDINNKTSINISSTPPENDYSHHNTYNKLTGNYNNNIVKSKNCNFSAEINTTPIVTPPPAAAATTTHHRLYPAVNNNNNSNNNNNYYYYNNNNIYESRLITKDSSSSSIINREATPYSFVEYKTEDGANILSTNYVQTSFNNSTAQVNDNATEQTYLLERKLDGHRNNTQDQTNLISHIITDDHDRHSIRQEMSPHQNHIMMGTYNDNHQYLVVDSRFQNQESYYHQHQGKTSRGDDNEHCKINFFQNEEMQDQKLIHSEKFNKCCCTIGCCEIC